MYKEVKPSTKLANVMDTFWMFSNHCSMDTHKILPDGCTDIIFDLKESKAFVSGTMTHFRMQVLKENTHLIGIRFKTEQFGRMTTLPALEITNLRIELSKVVPGNFAHTFEQLHHFSSINMQLESLEEFVMDILSKHNPSADDLVLSIVKKIRNAKGNINVSSLAATYFLSVRQLERRFKGYLGITLKQFASIVRFHHARQIIMDSSHLSLSRIAFQTGFFDPAHMNHEFKRLAGEVPGYFR